MIYSSIWWLFLLLGPILYWSLPARLRAPFLMVTSVALLAVYAGSALLVMLLVGLVAYGAFHPVVDRLPERLQRVARSPFPFAFVLGYFVIAKYIPPLANSIGQGGSFLDFAVPLGVSYFSFKLLHYVLEMRRGNIPAHSFSDYGSWLFCAPIFTAGPIERFEHYLRERHDQSFKWDFVVEGALRIAQGLVKKHFLAVLFIELLQHVSGGGNLASMLSGLDGANPAALWGAMLLTLVLVYLDFSAYSDIAIGSSLLFGLRIMENFNFPFIATSLPNFWQRWHMTLASFCRAYIYMPMIGLTRNPYYAATATFGVMGLWHAASLHWITWGLWHGFGMSVVAAWGRYAGKHKWRLFKTSLGAVVGWFLTICFVSLGGTFTALHGVASYSDAWRMVLRAFGISL